MKKILKYILQTIYKKTLNYGVSTKNMFTTNTYIKRVLISKHL